MVVEIISHCHKPTVIKKYHQVATIDICMCFTKAIYFMQHLYPSCTKRNTSVSNIHLMIPQVHNPGIYLDRLHFLTWQPHCLGKIHHILPVSGGMYTVIVEERIYWLYYVMIRTPHDRNIQNTKNEHPKFAQQYLRTVQFWNKCSVCWLILFAPWQGYFESYNKYSV